MESRLAVIRKYVKHGPSGGPEVPDTPGSHTGTPKTAKIEPGKVRSSHLSMLKLS